MDQFFRDGLTFDVRDAGPADGDPVVLLHGFPQLAPAPTAPTAPEGADTREYTCPMHPEVRQIGPGACPKCGMALEPVTVSLEDDGNPELDDMMGRFRVSLALTLPILAFMISDMLPGQPLQHVMSPAAMTWTQFALASPVVLWGGWPFSSAAGPRS